MNQPHYSRSRSFSYATHSQDLWAGATGNLSRAEKSGGRLAPPRSRLLRGGTQRSRARFQYAHGPLRMR